MTIQSPTAKNHLPDISAVIGSIPYRMAFAGGWIDQPFMSRLNPTPPGYNPIDIKNLDVDWVRRLGQSGKDCYDAILARDATRLGATLNESMACWEFLLPHVVEHPLINLDLKGILKYYQARSYGAMYSGCGGGYLFVVSDEPVPGAFKVKVRISTNTQ